MAALLSGEDCPSVLGLMVGQFEICEIQHLSFVESYSGSAVEH